MWTWRERRERDGKGVRGTRRRGMEVGEGGRFEGGGRERGRRDALSVVEVPDGADSGSAMQGEAGERNEGRC
jgi:hypothetical protein